ncbi:hypothetical protein PYCC9005_005302 [Savitreella phatthalungensis]
MTSTQSQLSGTYAYTGNRTVQYGVGSIDRLPELLERFGKNKALIVTGNSLANKTKVIQNIQKILGDHHAETFTSIGEHAPVEGIEQALKILKEKKGDCIISVGGGSPIDACKAIKYYAKERNILDQDLFHIAVPTTLSAAEWTPMAGFTKDGRKTGVASPELAPDVVILDGELAMSTPQRLWLSTGIRALDHAVETQYRPYAPPFIQLLAQHAAADLFRLLRQHKQQGHDPQLNQQLLVAAWHSLFPYAQESKAKSTLGPSHALGYMLGSPYKIPHGICSCLTLGAVVRWKAQSTASDDDCMRLATIHNLVTGQTSKASRENAIALGKEIDYLLKDLGLDVGLLDQGMPKDDLQKVVAAAQPGDSEKILLSELQSRLW